jgi:hypothetical protein
MLGKVCRVYIFVVSCFHVAGITHHGVQHFKVILLIANGIPAIKGTTVAKQSKVSGCLVTNEKIRALACGGCLEVVAFSWRWMDQSDLFQKIRLGGGTRELSILCKANVNVLSESRRVVVSNSSGRLIIGLRRHLFIPNNDTYPLLFLSLRLNNTCTTRTVTFTQNSHSRCPDTIK